ncbi:MAG: flagellar protein FlaG [Proteobacteria bacterium]|nr:flagellar protein FlaG [Pseudomonadota bacterium]
MNINPSDMDVRQGYAPAEVAAQATQLLATASQTNQDRESAQPVAVDEKSQAAMAAADKKVALETAEKISKQLEANHTTIKIKLLDNTQDGVQVEILDKTSEKVLRKIPQDELIKLSASIKKMTGVFLNQTT